jgi:hypothetical protein
MITWYSQTKSSRQSDTGVVLIINLHLISSVTLLTLFACATVIGFSNVLVRVSRNRSQYVLLKIYQPI